MSLNKFKLFIQTLTNSQRNSNEYILKKILSLFLDEPNKCHEKENMLLATRSKDISKLLSLLEADDAIIRKMTIIILSMILSNPRAKLMFMEKCGLALIPGKVFLTRLKFINKSINACSLLSTLSTTEQKNGTNDELRHSLFWFLPMSSITNLDLQSASLPLQYFDHYMLRKDETGELKLEAVPDPISNLCGIQITTSDLNQKIQISELHVLSEDESIHMETAPDSSMSSTVNKEFEINSQIFYSNIKTKGEINSEQLMTQSLVVQKPKHSIRNNEDRFNSKGFHLPSKSPVKKQEAKMIKQKADPTSNYSTVTNETSFTGKSTAGKSPMRNYGPIQRKNEASKSPIRNKPSNMKVKSPLRSTYNTRA